MGVVTSDDYLQYILRTLGAPTVKIEVEDQIPEFIEDAFLEVKNYITDVETMTLPYSEVIDLSGKKVANVVGIMRGHNSTGPGGFQDVMYIYSRQSATNTYTLTDYARALMAGQNKSALSTDLDFHYDKREQKLYLYAQQALPTTITLIYTPDYESVEDIIEPFWQDYIRRLALAMTKQALGRVRSKYDLSSSTYKLDGDRLLSEAESELTSIREFLRGNSDMLFPID